MSANPQMMAQLLASQLGSQNQGVGGMQPQNSGALGGAAALAQKIMLMKALGQQPGQPPQPGMPTPPTVAPGNMLPQAANVPMPGGVNA